MELNIDFISLLGGFFTSIGLFISSFYLLRNKLHNDGYLFLYLALLLLSYEVFYKSLIHSRMIYDFIVLYYPGRFINFLAYPVFLLFIYSIVKKGLRWSVAHWILFFITVAYSFFSTLKGFAFSIEEKKRMLDLFYQDSRPGPFNYWNNLNTLFKFTLFPLAFLSLIGYEFFTFRKRIKNIQNKRLLNFVAAIIIIYFLYHQISNSIYQLAFQITNFSMIEWPVDIFFLSIIVLLMVLVALSVNSGDEFFPPTKYQKNPLAQSTYEQLIASAKDIIEREQLYKKSKITLAALAQKIDTNPKYLSQSINAHLGISFADFINQYRVEEAKKLLQDVENKNLTLEAIGLQAGFNSKTTFFRAFKKFTNQTPNQFLKSRKSKDL
ncbi:MAG: helix-turn-helix domain-containing protein [Bacteroidota bacterium]